MKKLAMSTLVRNLEKYGYEITRITGSHIRR